MTAKSSNLNTPSTTAAEILNQPYDYYIVLDFESTCEEQRTKQDCQEIIEFPSVVVDSRSLQIVSSFQQYVKPVCKPILSPFCVQRTGIQQQTVDSSPNFMTVFEMYIDWLSRMGFDPNRSEGQPSFCIVTHGDWDLNEMLPRQWRISESTSDGATRRNWASLPKCFLQWVNIKSVFSKVTGLRHFDATTIPSLLQYFDLKPEGRLHSGFDDCKNIATVLIAIMRLARVEVTERPKCYICKGGGHFARDCPLGVERVSCHGCGQLGHLLRNCPNGGSSFVNCYVCQQPGHYARNCPIAATQGLPSEGPQRCFQCGELGHFARECTNAAMSQSVGQCYTCGKTGHFFRDCPYNVSLPKCPTGQMSSHW